MIADIQTEHHSFGSAGSPPYLIAEIGLNHNGDLDLARRIVDAARTSGAHAAKFQLFQSRAFINPTARLGDGAPGGLAEFFAQFELDADEWHILAKHTREQGLDFFCSVFDAPSLKFYRELDARLIKLSSCDIDNRMLFEDLETLDPGRLAPGSEREGDAAARSAGSSPGDPAARRDAGPAWAVLFSTGTADESEIQRAVSFLDAGRPRAIFECVSAYPAAPEDYNLAVLESWRERYACPVGISDHTTGNALSIAAVALGARMIERHFTLDRGLPGPDQALSLNPEDFRRMSLDVAQVFAARGGHAKTPAPSEDGPLKYGRRNLYAAREIAAGSTLRREDLIASRPGGTPHGHSPADYAALIGRVAVRDIAAHEILTRQALADAAKGQSESPDRDDGSDDR